jgi:hypothetical protein
MTLDVKHSSNFSLYPIQKYVTEGSVTVNWSAACFGTLVIGTNGIWNTNILPANGTGTFTLTNKFTAPLTASNYPNTRFCTFINLYLDDVSYPLVFTNSPELTSVLNNINTIPAQNLFWITLYRIGLSTEPSVSTESSPGFYHFGTDLFDWDTSNHTDAISIYSIEPITAETIFTIKYEYFDISDNLIDTINTSATLQPSQYTANILTDMPSTLTILSDGYIKITITSDNANLTPLLPFYFWGVSVEGSGYGF